MQFEDLMTGLAKEIGIEILAPDEEGVCQIVTERTVLSIRHCPEIGAVLCTAPIAELRPDYGEDVFRKLLAKNYLFAQTQGATISINEEDCLVYLMRYDFLEQMDDLKFYNKILGFFESVIAIQDELDTPSSDDAHDYVEEQIPQCEIIRL